MEETKITDNLKTLLLSGATSGLLTGLISSCCCCVPILAGVGGCWFYSYIEKRVVSNAGVMILALFGGFISAFPAYLISLLSQVYLEKNLSALPPEFSEFAALMPPTDFSMNTILLGFFSTLIMNSVFSFLGAGAYLLMRKK